MREFARIMSVARAALTDRENLVLSLYADENSLALIGWKLGVSKSQAKREFDRALGRLCRIMAARGCPVRCGSAQAVAPP